MKSIAECIADKKGDFQAVCRSKGPLQSGTKDGKDWTKRLFTLQDSSGEIVLTAWNDQCDIMEEGKNYEIKAGWFKEYNGKMQLSLGKYGQVISGVNTASHDEYLQKRSAEIKQQTATIEENNKNLALDQGTQEFVEYNTELLYKINRAVLKKLHQYEVDPNPAMTGQFTKIIWDKLEAK